GRIAGSAVVDALVATKPAAEELGRVADRGVAGRSVSGGPVLGVVDPAGDDGDGIATGRSVAPGVGATDQNGAPVRSGGSVDSVRASRARARSAGGGPDDGERDEATCEYVLVSHFPLIGRPTSPVASIWLALSFFRRREATPALAGASYKARQRQSLASPGVPQSDPRVHGADAKH